MSNYTPGVPGGLFGLFKKIDDSFKASGLTVRTTRVKDTEAAIAKEKLALKTAQNNAAIKEAAIVAYKKAQNPKLKPEGPGTPTAAQQTALNILVAEKTVFLNNAIAAKSKIATLENDLKKLKADLTTYNKQLAPKDEKPPVIVSSGDADKLVYEYNAPMLTSAYLNPFGPQAGSLTDKNLIGAPVNDFTNARLAWKGVTPARGTIQMSKIFAANWKGKPPKGIKRNETPYGFRFLYNPTDVSMAWGIVDAFSPEYAQSGANGMSGVAVGLMKGTIAFTLLLNRINDMNVLDKNGIKATIDPISIPDDLDPAQRNQFYNEMYRKINPYPTTVSVEDQKNIWKRGTMYDIEYLFRAMGGYYADYKSGLNGTTADRGWLQPIPMELHLGTGLRYLVRVSSLDLKHMMFNERMVPTLTTVNVVCTRYYDSPDAFKDPTSTTSVGQDAYRPEG
jgi:hypothetical protein